MSAWRLTTHMRHNGLRGFSDLAFLTLLASAFPSSTCGRSGQRILNAPLSERLRRAVATPAASKQGSGETDGQSGANGAHLARPVGELEGRNRFERIGAEHRDIGEHHELEITPCEMGRCGQETIGHRELETKYCKWRIIAGRHMSLCSCSSPCCHWPCHVWLSEPPNRIPGGGETQPESMASGRGAGCTLHAQHTQRVLKQLGQSGIAVWDVVALVCQRIDRKQTWATKPSVRIALRLENRTQRGKMIVSFTI